MTPSRVRSAVVIQRASWIREMLAGIRALPLESLEAFRQDPRNIAAAESYLRRALEAVLDLGRHVLAKAFGRPVDEFKAIALALQEEAVLTQAQSDRLREMAGYRNRLVHFYDEIGDEELREICSQHLGDLETLLSAFLDWLRAHPEQVDNAL